MGIPNLRSDLSDFSKLNTTVASTSPAISIAAPILIFLPLLHNRRGNNQNINEYKEEKYDAMHDK